MTYHESEDTEQTPTFSVGPQELNITVKLGEAHATPSYAMSEYAFRLDYTKMESISVYFRGSEYRKKRWEWLVLNADDGSWYNLGEVPGTGESLQNLIEFHDLNGAYVFFRMKANQTELFDHPLYVVFTGKGTDGKNYVSNHTLTGKVVSEDWVPPSPAPKPKKSVLASSQQPNRPLVIPKELIKSSDAEDIKVLTAKHILEYYAARDRIQPTFDEESGADTLERLSDIETSSNKEKGLVPFDILDYYDLIHHMNGTRAHKGGDLQYESNEGIGCLGQIRRTLKLMDPNAEPTRVSVVQKVLPRGRYQFAPTYGLRGHPDDIEDESVKLMAMAAAKLHNAYFAKDHEMRLLLDWGTQCHPPILEWASLMPIPFYVTHSVQHIKGPIKSFDDYFRSTKWKNLKKLAYTENDLLGRDARAGLIGNRVNNIDHFQSEYESIIKDLRQIIGWSHDLWQHLTKHHAKKLYVTEKLIQDEGFQVEKLANGDLKVKVNNPSSALKTAFSIIANADTNISTMSLDNVARLVKYTDDENKHIALKAMGFGATDSSVKTLGDLVGLSTEERTKFLRVKFGMSKTQVYLLSKYMMDAYTEATTETGDGFVLIKTGDKYYPYGILHRPQYQPRWLSRRGPMTSPPVKQSLPPRIVQQADVDKIYEVIVELDATNSTFGTETVKNQWMLGFSELYGEWTSYATRTTEDVLARHPDLAPIPGMVEFTDEGGVVWCMFNHGRGKNWWFPKKELPCGDLGRIWYDKKLKTYVFVWFYRNPDGSLDKEKNKPYFQDWDDPDVYPYADFRRRYVKPLGQLVDLHKHSYSGEGSWGHNITPAFGEETEELPADSAVGADPGSLDENE